VVEISEARSLYERWGGAGDDFNDIGRSRGESLHASGRILLAAENCSELQLQGQLDRARAADLVERIEAAVGSARAKAAGQSLGRVAKESVGDAVVGRAEVGVIEDVEELATETESDFLGEVKLPLEGDVGLRGSEAAEHVAPEISLLAGGRRSEGRAIQNLPARVLRAKKFKWLTRDHIWPRIKRGTRANKKRTQF